MSSVWIQIPFHGALNCAAITAQLIPHHLIVPFVLTSTINNRSPQNSSRKKWLSLLLTFRKSQVSGVFLNSKLEWSVNSMYDKPLSNVKALIPGQMLDQAMIRLHSKHFVTPDVRQYLLNNIVLQRRVKLDTQLGKAVQSLRDVELYHARLSAGELDAQVQVTAEHNKGFPRKKDGQWSRSFVHGWSNSPEVQNRKERQAEVKAEIEESTRILRAMEAEYNELLTADIEEEVTNTQKFEETSGPLDTKQRENLKDQIAQQKQDVVDVRITEASEILNFVGREHGEARQRMEALTDEMFAMAQGLFDKGGI
ncbi:hypothetical protein C8J56DRAFT_904063 [Mycena floridula]|nr:hypothetical protein C8J56DRAFT_904063 [Mycena floridula]